MPNDMEDKAKSIVAKLTRQPWLAYDVCRELCSIGFAGPWLRQDVGPWYAMRRLPFLDELAPGPFAAIGHPWADPPMVGRDESIHWLVNMPGMKEYAGVAKNVVEAMRGADAYLAENGWHLAGGVPHVAMPWLTREDGTMVRRSMNDTSQVLTTLERWGKTKNTYYGGPEPSVTVSEWEIKHKAGLLVPIQLPQPRFSITRHKHGRATPDGVEYRSNSKFNAIKAKADDDLKRFGWWLPESLDPRPPAAP